ATTNSSYPNKGNHGWDNELPSMRAIFMGKGPAFKRSFEFDTLNNVDVYHIVCHILNLKPNVHANDGSINDLLDIFQTIDHNGSTTTAQTSTSTHSCTDTPSIDDGAVGSVRFSFSSVLFVLTMAFHRYFQ